jgi:DNA-binding NarL/FixJ family response regulator
MTGRAMNGRTMSSMPASQVDRIRVVVVDDQTLFREGIRQLLELEPEITVLAEGGSGPEAVRLARQHRPDVILLDVAMPGEGAAATIDQIRAVSPHTRVIILTMHDNPDLMRELTDRGASAYLVKSVSRKELAAVVRMVPRSADTIVLYVPRRTLHGLDRSDRDLLSPRELGVLQLVAQALSNAQIAHRLSITEATVKRHLSNIYPKLGAVSRLDAINKALATGLIRRPGEPSDN